MKKIFYLCIMLLLIPTYVNAGQINANYGIESGGSVSSNGNLVGNFNKSGLSNSLSVHELLNHSVCPIILLSV